MARLELYLTQPLAEAMGWALLHSLWQGALVALLFAIGLALLRGRDPRLRYLLGCAALVPLIALPAATGVTLYNSGTQTRAALPDIGSTVSTASAERIAPRQGEVATPTILAAPLASSPLEDFTAHVMITLQNSAPWLAAVWLVGVVLLLLRLLGQALYVHRFRARHQTPADAAWQARARALASRLGVRHAWRLVQSNRTDSPLTFGVLRPLIVLPTSAITGMPAVQLEAVLAHELAHVRRHDYLVNLLQCVAEALLFYHPAVWWVSSTVRRAREECCDDVAVEVCGDAKLYARALTNLETLRQQRPALALAATDMPLLARVRRLLGLGKARYAPPLATGALLFLTVAATAVLSFIPLPVAAQNADEPRTQPGSLWISVSRGVTFNDAYTRISKLDLLDSSYVLVEERTATEQRAVRVTRGAANTNFVYTYTVDGAARPFNAQAQAWLDDSLQAGALGPLKEYATNRFRNDEREEFHLVSHLDYDDVSNRYISFALVADAHLEPSSMSTIEASLGKRNLLSHVAHYAAHDLVADSETGDYLKLFIERSRVAQLETLTPDIMSIIAELEDEAVKVDVRQSLEARLRNTAEQQERVAGRTSTVAPTSSANLSAPTLVSRTKDGASRRDLLTKGVITGRVEWRTTPLANVKVVLRTPIEMLDEENCCKPQRTLRTTTTDENGAYRFEDVPFGTYALRAIPATRAYQPTESQTTLATSYAELYVTLQTYKRLAIIGPTNETGVSLTPTLRWQPLPGAVRYEVTLFNVVTGKFVPLGEDRTTPSLTVDKPLERDTLYSWSVVAYAEGGLPIAANYEPSFSTSPKTVPMPVELPSLGVRTVLRNDWQQRASNIFERPDKTGAATRIEFSKVAGTDPRAVLRERRTGDAVIGEQPFAGRAWWYLSSEGGPLYLATRQGSSVYLIAVEDSKDEKYRTEFAGFVMPEMLRNFEIDRQP